ncbi:hypothetical protein [Endozoicomonas sp. YOMI1]|uniref:hypothetical protein n=1 Tax=Endozoicomonas sp. YOMI1 TaxID=2828739 RepID=UPI0021494BDE|nr:hypothetical protein [Endozoicomonas sp. YOMI1]
MSFDLHALLLGSTSFFEDDNYSFVFPIFALYFFYSGNKRNAILALALSVLTLKRIALVGFFIGFFYMLMPANIKNKRVVVVFFALTFNLIYLYASYFITTDYFNELSLYYTNTPAAHFTMGRSAIYSALFDGRSFFDHIFGSGLGKTYYIAADIYNTSIKYNLHSVILKLYYEIGILSLLTFVFFLYKNASKSAIPFVIYFNVLLFTDNVITYFFVMFFYFLVLYCVVKNGDLE